MLNDFVEFIGVLIDSKHEDLGIKSNDEFEAKWTVDRLEISHIRQALNEDHVIEGTVIYMKSGDSFWVSMSYEDVKSKWLHLR